MLKKSIIISLTLTSLTGCSLFQSTRCERAIEYQGYKVTITSLSVPLSGSKNFSIGKAEWDPKLLRKTSELIEALDTVQYADCQALMMAKNNSDAFLQIYKHRNDTINKLVSILQTSRDAVSEDELRAVTESMNSH